jgi:hypothetical protein
VSVEELQCALNDFLPYLLAMLRLSSHFTPVTMLNCHSAQSVMLRASYYDATRSYDAHHEVAQRTGTPRLHKHSPDHENVIGRACSSRMPQAKGEPVK